MRHGAINRSKWRTTFSLPSWAGVSSVKEGWGWVKLAAWADLSTICWRFKLNVPCGHIKQRSSRGSSSSSLCGRQHLSAILMVQWHNEYATPARCTLHGGETKAKAESEDAVAQLISCIHNFRAHYLHALNKDRQRKLEGPQDTTLRPLSFFIHCCHCLLLPPSAFGLLLCPVWHKRLSLQSPLAELIYSYALHLQAVSWNSYKSQSQQPNKK